MRAIWSGSISFGLVNIPIKLFSASQSREGIDLNMLHKTDLSPIRYARICREDGKEIPYDEIVKGYEYQEGDYIEITDEDFKRADVKKTKTIDIKQFVDEPEIDSRYYEKPYYMEPTKGAEKPYALLREALRATNKIALAKFVLRNRDSLAAVKVIGNMLVLNQMRFPADVRTGSELKLPGQELADEAEIEVAVALIKQLDKPFIPEDWHDEYTEELQEIIDEKAKGKPVKVRSEEPQNTKVQDLMATLKASLEQEKK